MIVVGKTRKSAGFTIITIEAIRCGNPNISICVFHEVVYHIIAQAVLIFGIVPVNDKLIPVVPVQSVTGANPHKAPAILDYAVNVDL